MFGRSFDCFIRCFMSTVNSYGHVGTVICCLMCCFTSTVNSYDHVWTVICFFDVLLYVHGKQLWSCLDGHLFVRCVALRPR